ncbi:DNA-protecting protein DprA [Synechococcales cyanobacterium C]|uniref:DNA-protecting protein DprA n=1 Tax=Petrachloros mirabilis ULC683 TaxID=2781853 RepID=A0A8K2A194_9CYAN|nr:DNA-protecting protein DprA [Petrachloros mirabilis ULC683]
MDERIYWLVWSQIAGVGPVLLQRLQAEFGSLAAAWAEADLSGVNGIGGQTQASILRQRSQLHPEQLYTHHLRQNPHFWTPADPDYPRLLLEIADPPPVLYYRGQVRPEENQGSIPTVAMVGTRDPTDYGKRWTRRLAKTLTQKGFVVVSGMAEGIDTQAHQSCLEAGGRTIAVLGTGVDQIYPPRNQGLYQRIVETGLVLSEYPAGTQPNRAHFPRRNRIIAGLSRATLVLEAPKQSGALITAYLANDYSRDVYVLPGSLDNPKAMGCLGLVSRGAQLILGEGHLLELLGALPPLAPISGASSQADPTAGLSAELAEVYRLLRDLCQSMGQPAVPYDLLAAQTQQAPGTLSGALLQLELLGLVVQQPGMRYGLT